MTKKTEVKSLNILQRMNAAQKVVTYVQKNKPNGMKYSIVSHDDVTAKVRAPLVELGVMYYPVNMVYEQVGNRTQVFLQLKFCNIDDLNDFILVDSLGYGIDAQDKGPGKAVSYAVKYGLLKAMGLQTGDDADLDSIDHEVAEEVEWSGPIKKHALKSQLRAFNGDINSVEDSGSMQELMRQSEGIRKQCEIDLPDWFEPMEVAIGRAAKRVEDHSNDYS